MAEEQITTDELLAEIGLLYVQGRRLTKLLAEARALLVETEQRSAPQANGTASGRVVDRKGPSDMLEILILAPMFAAVDLSALIRGLIYLLLAAVVVGVVLYILIRLLSQFVPGFAPFSWILWAIGGLILVLIALNIFGSMLGG